MTSGRQSGRTYMFYECRDCEENFFIEKRRQKMKKYNARIHCPLCGENMFTEEIMEMNVVRPFQFKRKWTQEENEILELGLQSGYSVKEIEESLEGRTKFAIYKQMQRLRDEGVKI